MEHLAAPSLETPPGGAMGNHNIFGSLYLYIYLQTVSSFLSSLEQELRGRSVRGEHLRLMTRTARACVLEEGFVRTPQDGGTLHF